MYIKQNNKFVKTIPFVKVNGKFTKINYAYTKVNNKWMLIYKDQRNKKVSFFNKGYHEFVVPENVFEIEIIAVAGGGSGHDSTKISIDEGGYSGIGGKAGQYINTFIQVYPNQIINIEVGGGGEYSKDGGDTIIENIILKGGLSGISNNIIGNGQDGNGTLNTKGIGGFIDQKYLLAYGGSGGKGWGAGGGGAGTGTRSNIAFAAAGWGGDGGIVVEGIGYPQAGNGQANGGYGGFGADGIVILKY